MEEFGIGLPPRLIGKKIGETLYSLNLLPLGAFVKLYGEEEEIKSPESFSGKPIWQRVLIVIGGVVMFWLIAFLILSLVAGIWGIPKVVGDEENSQGLANPKVMIIKIAPDSPAEKAGLKMGDVILEIQSPKSKIQSSKVKDIQEFINAHLGEELILKIQRGKEILEISLVPRVSPPEGEGAMGVALVRTAQVISPWYSAPWEGLKITATTTLTIPYLLGNLIKKAIKGEPIKEKVELRGPIGIGELMLKQAEMGANHFLYFLAMIAIFIALFNILPIPALDGGKLLFLAIEGIRKKPLPQKIEQGITTFFFALLLILIIWVTIKDIERVF